ncbi:MAG: MBL fold metallo-hydrolase [Phycisphaeraceae bacterium]
MGIRVFTGLVTSNPGLSQPMTDTATSPAADGAEPTLGKLRLSPYRLQGLSVAGEHTFVQVPELELSFDLGRCPRETLVSKTVAISHGHVDHIAGLHYYLCQRQRLNLGPARLICHPALVQPLRDLARASATLDAHDVPVEIIPLNHNEQLRLHEGEDLFLRAFATRHTVPSLGYVVFERRKRLRKEVSHLPFERLEALQARGEPVMERHDAPLVCYTGDTHWGEHFQRRDVQRAKILITECTFLEPGQLPHARLGKHLHLDHIVSLLEMVRADAVVLTHLPRRLPMARVRKLLDHAIPARHRDRVFVLMDHAVNTARS